ncbi:carboxypeptidase-like regulatory domain-containing protein [Hymenobacter cheonanensis]|uniref:carboxypeptidase-like regulatory domain-containing protein n=1 Tax=Hymenobacter sp. CA2-7 TaxID=3063993 RepID=UPI00271330B0|nr:carboxypeptidase-like regulatory domain-containing protein [Hymenobacter sp. CA2-7]MDO7887210.1 carboxypeptidase-like regulatory domain-containing protein [Hymenobacter sp. CA2-7]
MNSFFLVRSLPAKASLLLAGALASCSRGPEQSVAAPTSASAPVQASALAPVPAPARPAPGSRATTQAAASPALRPAEPVAAPEITVAAARPTSPKPAPAAPGPAATYLQAGRVLDESGQPLVGATVLLRGTSRGTSTDASGSYLLEVPKGENTFLIGYAGYEDETARSHDGQPLTVTLLPAPGASPGPPAKGRRGQR